jgi:hypothetical protein
MHRLEGLGRLIDRALLGLRSGGDRCAHRRGRRHLALALEPGRFDQALQNSRALHMGVLGGEPPGRRRRLDGWNCATDESGGARGSGESGRSEGSGCSGGSRSSGGGSRGGGEGAVMSTSPTSSSRLSSPSSSSRVAAMPWSTWRAATSSLSRPSAPSPVPRPSRKWLSAPLTTVICSDRSFISAFCSARVVAARCSVPAISGCACARASRSAARASVSTDGDSMVTRAPRRAPRRCAADKPNELTPTLWMSRTGGSRRRLIKERGARREGQEQPPPPLPVAKHPWMCQAVVNRSSRTAVISCGVEFAGGGSAGDGPAAPLCAASTGARKAPSTNLRTMLVTFAESLASDSGILILKRPSLDRPGTSTGLRCRSKRCAP